MNNIDPLDAFLYREHIKKKKEPENKPDAEKKPEVKTNYFVLIGVLIFLIAFAILAGKFMTSMRPEPSSYAYWQARINISICGEERHLPRTDADYLGTRLVNTRNDDLLHIQGMVNQNSNITLGQFFDVIKVPFDSEKIMDIKKGDECNGEPGELKMYVNGIERKDFRDYMIAKTEQAEDQVISIVFE